MGQTETLCAVAAVVLLLLFNGTQSSPVAKRSENVCHESSCYVIVTEKLTWAEAKTRCLSLGGELVSINDDAENEVVHELASDLGQNVLIGGYEMKSNEKCRKFGARTQMSFTNWALGKPDHDQPAEDCVELKHSDGKWNDIQCDLAHFSVCETPKEPPKPTKPPVVDADWDCTAISCYSTIDQELSWSSAQEKCVSIGGNLVQIDDNAENERVHEIARGLNGNVFIGGHDTKSESTFHWIGSNDPMKYTNWAFLEPNDYGSGEDCVELYHSNGQWNDIDCNAARYSVCEKVRDPADPKTWECKEFSCYTTLPEKLTWYAAQDKCQEVGANLVQIDNSKENSRIHRFATELGNNVFIGAHDSKDENKWYWVGSNLIVAYTNWAFLEPNDYGTGEDCVELYHNDGKWNDRSCSETRHGVCEKPYVKCDEKFENSCYVLVKNEASWHEAEDHCALQGAYLAEITSREENDVVHGLSTKINKSVYIGAHDVSNEGNFVWSHNNSPVTYTNWAWGEPNNFFNNEDCVEVYTDGNWNDIDCNAARASVCEMHLK